MGILAQLKVANYGLLYRFVDMIDNESLQL
jgi:hypothetical protein